MIVLPSFVADSVVLTADEKYKLASVGSLPTDQDVDNIRYSPTVQDILNAFIGDENTKNLNLQLKAKEYIEESNLFMAWCVLLL